MRESHASGRRRSHAIAAADELSPATGSRIAFENYQRFCVANHSHNH